MISEGTQMDTPKVFSKILAFLMPIDLYMSPELPEKFSKIGLQEPVLRAKTKLEVHLLGTLG